ncbi:Uncharacterised protein [Mycobacteroides abscessus subsp. abscessus]|nr:Uncharacterised protein [Mycobacteroides abscessus subsp. abscessus]
MAWVPGCKPARSMEATSSSRASSLESTIGHQPPSSATPASLPRSESIAPQAR